MKGLTILVALLTTSASAQTLDPQMRCKQLVEAKVANQQYVDRMLGDLGPEIIAAWHYAKYEAKSGRCYMEAFRHAVVGRMKDHEYQIRSFTDLQTEEIVAFARIEDGKKIGLVFDPQHKTTSERNLGFDDANLYIDSRMTETGNNAVLSSKGNSYR